MDNLKTEEELKRIIDDNNKKMENLLNEDPDNITNNSSIESLLIHNVSLYKIARERKISVSGLSLMRAVASMLGYAIDDKCNLIKENDLTKRR